MPHFSVFGTRGYLPGGRVYLDEEHPSLAELDDRAAFRLTVSEAQIVDDHLRACPKPPEPIHFSESNTGETEAPRVCCDKSLCGCETQITAVTRCWRV